MMPDFFSNLEMTMTKLETLVICHIGICTYGWLKAEMKFKTTPDICFDLFSLVNAYIYVCRLGLATFGRSLKEQFKMPTW